MSLSVLLPAVRAHTAAALSGFLPEGLVPPLGFTLVPRVQTLPDKALPALQVASAGLVKEPESIDGVWWAWWSIGVSVYCRGATWDDTQTRTAAYADAVEPCLRSSPGLAGADGYRWVDTLVDLPSDPDRTGRTLGGCAVVVAYLLPAADAVPLSADPSTLVLDHAITVQPVQITEELP